MTIRRRDALKHLGALAGAIALPKLSLGCGDNSTTESGPGSINTLVVVMMENRSYDHVLGARSFEGLPGDGLVDTMSNLEPDGSEVRVYADPVAAVPDPPHSWASCHRQWADGANSGFLTEYRATHGTGGAPHAMGYLTRAEQPVTWAIADAFASADRWFSSILGPTWPNRFYLHSGEAGGLISNEIPTGGLSWPSIAGVLQQAGIEWRYYFSNLPVAPLFEDVIVEGNVRRMNDFFNDARSGSLAPVVFVDPTFFVNDDHPPQDPVLGQQFIASIYAALAASPQWNNSLLVVTYDEHGGFYDHVPPPTTADERAADGFGQLGIRVPTLVAGPYVKEGFVSSEVYDHSSVVAHITRSFGLDALTVRDAAANDLSDFIDTERLAAGAAREPITLPAVEIDESMVRRAEQIRATHRLELDDLADAGTFGALDHRGRVRDALFEIGDFLESVNAGRIRRGR